MAEINPQFRAQVQKVVAALDTLDYFQLLRIKPDASDAEIRSGYHQQARTFHPDRYNHLGAPDLVRDLTMISKRITEAYVTLRDPQKLARYRKNISGPKREQMLRYTQEQERQEFADEQATKGDTLQGRQMLEEAQGKYDKGDIQGAVNSLKMAIAFERNNQSFKALMRKWERELA